MTDSILHPDLVALAQRVVDENRRVGRTFTLAESCTGGLVSAAITEIPGSSEVFEASFVTYSNEIKQEILKVSQDVLETFGSVSIACAWNRSPWAPWCSRGPSGAPIPIILSPTCVSSRIMAAPACGFRRRCARLSCCCHSF